MVMKGRITLAATVVAALAAGWVGSASSQEIPASCIGFMATSVGTDEGEIIIGTKGRDVIAA